MVSFTVSIVYKTGLFGLVYYTFVFIKLTELSRALVDGRGRVRWAYAVIFFLHL